MTRGDRLLANTPTQDALSIAARRHPLVREVDRQLAAAGLRIGRHSEGNRPVKAVVAVSGGPDSLALLLTLVALAHRRERTSVEFESTVVHVHHHLRASADADAELVSRLCTRLNVPCELVHVHPASESGNLAAAARRLRYGALTEMAKKVSASVVLVAHHAEDQFETVLMALCRGAGPRGLAGMPLRCRRDGVTIVRPLLEVTKAECLSMCKSAGVKWSDDPSNRDVTRRRARLRKDIVPVLDSLWPGAASRAAVTAELNRAAAESLNREVARVFGAVDASEWPRSHLQQQSLGVVLSGLRAKSEWGPHDPKRRLNMRTLMKAAKAVLDDNRKPRVFRVAPGVAIHVESKLVKVCAASE